MSMQMSKATCESFQLVFGFVWCVMIDPILAPGMVDTKAIKKKMPI
jgi:hypothetical protein